MRIKFLIVFCVLFLVLSASFGQTNNTNIAAAMPRARIIEGTSVTLSANSVNAVAYQWFKNEIAIDGAVHQTCQVNSAGIYQVQSFNGGSCNSDISQAVEVVVVPVTLATADIAIGKKSEIRNVVTGESFEYLITVNNKGANTATQLTATDLLPDNLELIEILTPQKGSATYNRSGKTIIWTIASLANGEKAELRIRTKALSAGLVNNTATVAAFETDNDPSNNTVTDSKEITGLQLPNVFTPNGDNINDTYQIRGLDIFVENEFVVINRWGNHVYESKNYQNDWSGDGLNEGTYFYVLTVKTVQGSKLVYKGYITLLRTK